ncbi:MAG: hypothetical protein CMM39_07240 [Rhodospirillaceae bacterium]|nr:hypothetical protein [Rhodospirillaceae bacterium]MDG1275538.1 DUF1330 domain-containing protein [Alphaproteobacteria bacterium]MDG1887808.1 DUF1330 domain-containing protein [Alphaproteobacteria bacterium]|tara:strand:- start:1056 stop:1352 length:297 start_codon:yes stop_codon:yes gene_type:complete
MSYGYVVAHVDVTDQNAFEKYSSQVPLVTEAFGGQYLARGGQQESLEGVEPLGNRTVIIRFDSYKKALKWYHSNEYTELVKLRQAGSNGTLMVVEGAD